MKQYKYISLDETEIIFRLLSAEESDRIYQTSTQRNPHVDEFLFNFVTSNKYNPDELTAGIIPTVVYISLKLSGVLQGKKDFPKHIDESRAKLNDNAYFIIYATIVKAQPSYTLDIIKQKTLTELLELYTFSEMILGKQIIDTKKIYKLLEEESGAKPTRGINSVTSEELEALKMSLGNDEYGGMPPDEFSF